MSWTADWIAASVPDTPKLLMPALLDLHGWQTFVKDWLARLDSLTPRGRWEPRSEFGFAFHPYSLSPAYVSQLLHLIKPRGWDLYLTEQGYQLETELVGAQWTITPPAADQLAAQLEHERAFFQWCSTQPRIAMYCHYQNRVGNIHWFTALYDYSGALTPLGEAWFASKTGLGLPARIAA